MKMYEDWFDPCPLNPNWTVDGLKLDWKDKTFVNPPYSKPKPWVEKAIEESKRGKRIVMLLNVEYKYDFQYFGGCEFAGGDGFHGKCGNW